MSTPSDVGLSAGLLYQACRFGVGLLVDIGDDHAVALLCERLSVGVGLRLTRMRR